MGVELFRDIEERWDKGRFGAEYQACDDPEVRRRWDKRTGMGRAKIFEVRRIYNDVTFIDEFITPEFAEDQRLFVYGRNPSTGQVEIVDRDWRKVKDQLLTALTNFGNPIIRVVDGNHKNRGELYLLHDWSGSDIQFDHAMLTLQNVFQIWKRPVHLETLEGGKGRLLSVDGDQTSTKEITPSKPGALGVGAGKPGP
jgi:stage V sporulation protein R